MCGILFCRASCHHVANIRLMLCLTGSLVVTTYTIDVILFWEQAEVFLGFSPLIILFEMSAQGKPPRVGYSTQF